MSERGHPRELRFPFDEEILEIVGRRQPVNLREISMEFWPGLSWFPRAPGGDSARFMPRIWLDPGSRIGITMAAAEYLYCRCQTLVKRGLLMPGRHDHDEVDYLAGHVYYVGPNLPAQSLDVLAQEDGLPQDAVAQTG